MSVTEIVKCLEIIDEGCNLKQFDAVADSGFTNGMQGRGAIGAEG